MNFAAYEFWRILVICFVASRLVLGLLRHFRPRLEPLAAKLCLFLTTLILLGSESILTLGAFLWVVTAGWVTISVPSWNLPVRVKQIAWLLALLTQVAPLFYFKYWDFILNGMLGLDLRIPSVLIPMGLSFYTFQALSLSIDNFRRPNGRPAAIDYLNFLSFFPQVVAGPIETRDSLLPQISGTRFRIARDNAIQALQWVILGLGYKLILADNLGLISDKLHIDPRNSWHVWLECLAFGLRIYFDFAGYSFIAIGLALLFGVRLTLHFRCPYWATDLRRFWQSWHVSLGAWLRTYIYLPLGGGRVPWVFVNVMVVFLISGIWHGAGWGFLIWGALHGIGVALSGLSEKFLRLRSLQWSLTFAYITAAWLFFFERDFGVALSKAASLINPFSYSLSSLNALGGAFDGPTTAITCALILALSIIALAIEGLGIRLGMYPYKLFCNTFATVCLVIMTILLAPMEESSFIYFNF